MLSTKPMLTALALVLPLAVSCTRDSSQTDVINDDVPEVSANETTNPGTTDAGTNMDLRGSDDMSVTDGGRDAGVAGATGDRVRTGTTVAPVPTGTAGSREPASSAQPGETAATTGTTTTDTTSTTSAATSPSDESTDATVNDTPATTGSTASTGSQATTSSSVYSQVQAALRDRGYVVSSGDQGGPETTRALQQFQAENDLPVTGTVDDPTLRALNISNDGDRQPASVDEEDAE